MSYGGGTVPPSLCLLVPIYPRVKTKTPERRRVADYRGEFLVLRNNEKRVRPDDKLRGTWLSKVVSLLEGPTEATERGLLEGLLKGLLDSSCSREGPTVSRL